MINDPFAAEDEGYRTCAECGRDCEPEPFLAEGEARISFACPWHGVTRSWTPSRAGEATSGSPARLGHRATSASRDAKPHQTRA